MLGARIYSEARRLIIGKLREFAKRVPVLPSAYRIVRDQFARYQLKSKASEGVFNDIYRRRAWGGRESFSGSGSDVEQTRIIITEIPGVLRDFDVTSILDIPCGDFNWMKNVDVGVAAYMGADIVEDLIRDNADRYGGDHIQFRRMNLLRDRLPKVDLVLCRDCLVHFSFAAIFLALENICRSRSEYLLTTTFPAREDNHDVAMGGWRALNLERPPFSFPSPLRIIREGCTEGDGAYEDKSLALWRTADIRKILKGTRK